MLRVIVQTDHANMAGNVGGNVLTTVKSFDIFNPQLEEFLAADQGRYGHRQVIGVEMVGDLESYIPSEQDKHEDALM